MSKQQRNSIYSAQVTLQLYSTHTHIRGKRGGDVILSKTHQHAGIHHCITDKHCLHFPYHSSLLGSCCLSARLLVTPPHSIHSHTLSDLSVPGDEFVSTQQLKEKQTVCCPQKLHLLSLLTRALLNYSTSRHSLK